MPAPRHPSAREAALGRRSYVSWECADCAAVLPFPREAELACPRCGKAPQASARLAARLDAAAASAGDAATRTWLQSTASAWRAAVPS